MLQPKSCTIAIFNFLILIKQSHSKQVHIERNNHFTFTTFNFGPLWSINHTLHVLNLPAVRKTPTTSATQLNTFEIKKKEPGEFLISSFAELNKAGKVFKARDKIYYIFKQKQCLKTSINSGLERVRYETGSRDCLWNLKRKGRRALHLRWRSHSGGSLIRSHPFISRWLLWFLLVCGQTSINLLLGVSFMWSSSLSWWNYHLPVWLWFYETSKHFHFFFYILRLLEEKKNNADEFFLVWV